MRTVAGSIVVLADAIMVGGSGIANAVLGASNQLADATTKGIMFGGGIVGLVGFGILFITLAKPATENK